MNPRYGPMEDSGGDTVVVHDPSCDCMCHEPDIDDDSIATECTNCYERTINAVIQRGISKYARAVIQLEEMERDGLINSQMVKQGDRYILMYFPVRDQDVLLIKDMNKDEV